MRKMARLGLGPAKLRGGGSGGQVLEPGDPPRVASLPTPDFCPGKIPPVRTPPPPRTALRRTTSSKRDSVSDAGVF